MTSLELTFVVDPHEDFICTICTKVLIEPHVTECCGQHFCEQCLKKWFQEQGTTICPHCRSVNFTHIRYLPMKRKINELLVYCLNRNEGCTVIVTVSQVNTHLNECSYTTVKCSNKCGQSLLRKDLSDHLTSDCINRLSTCVYCLKQDRYFLIAGSHQLDCPDFPVGCPKNCPGGSEVKRKNLNTHRLTCPLQPVQCTDCHAQLLRKQLPEHLECACPKRMVLCPYCSLQMTFDVSTKHKQTCPEYPIVCPRHCNPGHELKRKDLETHTLVCPLEPIRCNNCSVELIRKEIEEHCEKECPKRLSKCKYCNREGPYDHISGNHKGECEEFPAGCPRKCKGSEHLRRKNLKFHAKVCPLEPVQCPFSDVGCNPILLRRNLNGHLKSNLEKHMLKLMSAHTQLAAEHDKLRSDHNKLRGEFSKLNNEHTKLCNDHTKLCDDHKTLKSTLTDTQAKHTEMATSFSKMTSVISREKQMPQGKKFSLQCINTALNPNLKDEKDKLTFHVPLVTNRWSSPLYILDGYKMSLVFSKVEHTNKSRW